MSIERYEPRSPARKNSASVAHRSRRVPSVDRNRRFDVHDKVRFVDGAIIEPPIGAVIAITGEHPNSYGVARGRRYDYAAIRAGNGRWYTTGSSCPPFGYGWQQFLEFLISLENAEGERLR
jgi:hypothetical protein